MSLKPLCKVLGSVSCERQQIVAKRHMKAQKGRGDSRESWEDKQRNTENKSWVEKVNLHISTHMRTPELASRSCTLSDLLVQSAEKGLEHSKGWLLGSCRESKQNKAFRQLETLRSDEVSELDIYSLTDKAEK